MPIGERLTSIVIDTEINHLRGFSDEYKWFDERKKMNPQLYLN